MRCSTATISADRGQKSFKLSLDQFLAKRGGNTIVSRGRALKAQNAALFAQIPTAMQLAGGALILGGVLWYSRMEGE